MQAGIDIKADFTDAAVFVADLGKQDFDWAMYAYYVSPDPGNAVPILSLYQKPNYFAFDKQAAGCERQPRRPRTHVQHRGMVDLRLTSKWALCD